MSEEGYKMLIKTSHLVNNNIFLVFITCLLKSVNTFCKNWASFILLPQMVA